MGKMSFLLPPGLPTEMFRDLERACLAGGFDNAPVPTQVMLGPRRMTVQRTLDESGYLLVPWEVQDIGRLMVSTATLVERDEPYSLTVELARGKIHHTRTHLADWRLLGFPASATQEEEIRALSRAFGRAAIDAPSETADRRAQTVLRDAVQAADRCVQHYVDHLLKLRHHKNPKLDTALGCQITALPPNHAETLAGFNSLRVALTWRDIEPAEAHYHWENSDAIVDWAQANGISLSAGPLLDLARGALPDWLSLWEGDPTNIANFMCDYVETVISRYKGRIRRWVLTTAGNVSSVLELGEDDMLWLTARIAEAALQIDPELELVIGVAQPWGEYLARDEQTYTPLVFLDTLIRAGVRLAALDVELLMGVSPRGSYCRDLLDVNRLLDSFAVLSTPLQVTLACPSSTAKDKNADAEFAINAGRWNAGYSTEFQAQWAAQFASVALCKPYVNGIYWAHLSDAEPHRFPNCGLLDAKNVVKPALIKLRQLREQHAR